MVSLVSAALACSLATLVLSFVVEAMLTLDTARRFRGRSAPRWRRHSQRRCGRRRAALCSTGPQCSYIALALLAILRLEAAMPPRLTRRWSLVAGTTLAAAAVSLRHCCQQPYCCSSCRYPSLCATAWMLAGAAQSSVLLALPLDVRQCPRALYRNRSITPDPEGSRESEPGPGDIQPCCRWRRWAPSSRAGPLAKPSRDRRRRPRCRRYLARGLWPRRTWWADTLRASFIPHHSLARVVAARAHHCQRLVHRILVQPRSHGPV